jgi:hypothetical protein
VSKIHYFQRYSSVENTVTNNTLQLIARISDYSTSQASKLLSEITGEQIDIGIDINQQRPTKESVPDGAIFQNSFKILIEAKVDASVSEDQLLRHAKSFTSEAKKILILLTKQKIGKAEEIIGRKIASLQPGLIFRNITYQEICKAIQGLFKEHEYEMSSLVEDYIEYCNDVKLFDQSKYLLRVVPCSYSVAINKKYGIYFQPSDRGYTEHSFIGIYANKSVQSIWQIDSVFDIEFDGSALKKTFVQGRDTNEYDKGLIGIIHEAKTLCNYQIATDHRFFCGSPIDTDYRKSSPGGIQGARFINLRDEIGEFADVADVAMKLRGLTWV